MRLPALVEFNDGRQVTQVDGFGPQRAAAEVGVASEGIVLPLSQRAEVLQAQGCSSTKLFLVRDGVGRLLAAAATGTEFSHALPGHTLVRLQRFCANARRDVDDALLAYIAQVIRDDLRCLRFTVGLFERDNERRERLGATLGALGFVKTQLPRGYAKTLAIDLAPREAGIFVSVSPKARRDIRLPVKRGFQLRPIADLALAPRVRELMEETFRRTGAEAPPLPWTTIIELSRREPQTSRLSGLFQPGAPGHEGLVAFAWGCRNGDYVTYEAGASTRRPELGNTPLGYAPLWDLIAWACTTPASWFDLGGVTPVTQAATEDRLGGISDFKRHFSEHVVEVGEDWVLEPRPFRATLARALSAAARWTRGLLRRRTSREIASTNLTK